MTAAALPLTLANDLAARLTALRPALTIARRLYIPTDRDSLAELRVYVSPTSRKASPSARSLDEHTVELELATAQSLTGPDFETQAAAVLTAALDLAGLWLAEDEDDPAAAPLRSELLAGCRFASLNHDPLLDPGLLARGLALSLLTLTYSATYPA